MKILLDEMMPERFAPLLIGHEVSHVVDIGWRHITNGKLLALGESSGFEVLITKDSKIPYQQNLKDHKIAILILRPKSQDFDDLLSLAESVLVVLPTLNPGSATTVGKP